MAMYIPAVIDILHGPGNLTDRVNPPCGYCGMNPCSHQCPNSPHYYSPEQERYDDQFYGEHDKWEGWGDPDDIDPEDLPWDGKSDTIDTLFIDGNTRKFTIDSDDIPF